MADVLTHRLIEFLLFPPAGPLLLAGLAVLVWRLFPDMRRQMGTLLLVLLAGLWLLATPRVGYWLLDTLQDRFPPLREVPREADAIVVLGGGIYSGDARHPVNEYGQRDMLRGRSRERVDYAGWLARRTGLPVVVSGGRLDRDDTPEAELAARWLRKAFGLRKVLAEGESTTTRDNARRTRRLLAEHGWRRPLLVTHYWHMPRALQVFRAVGIDAIPAPTARWNAGPTDRGRLGWIATADGLTLSRTALHEWAGMLWYRWGPGRDVADGAGQSSDR